MRNSKPVGYLGKRAIDLIVATLLLVVFSLPMILIALLILIFMGRPILFRQSRPGLNEVPFVMLKFRTMANPSVTREAQLSDSRRITRLGAFLRATSLDELPELLNVIRGDMSMVGPRPLLLRYLPFYTETERRRHAVRPGITGLAQVSGRNSVPWDARLALDVSYVERASLLLDMRILGITALRVLLRHGVQVVATEHALDLDVERARGTDGGTSFDRANVADADIISQFILEHGASESLALSIVRAKNYSDYMHERLSDPHHQVWVARRLSRIVGVLEIKLINESAFVNHIYVAKNVRGTGIGRGLLQHGFTVGRVFDRTSLTELDVLSTNHVAREWYARLGFSERKTTTWSLFDITSLPCQDGTYEVIGWASAANQLARFGFCEFSIRTDRGHYQVGLPNADNYRVNGDAILGDPVAVGTLARLALSANLLVSRENTPEAIRDTTRANGWFTVTRLAAPNSLLYSRLIGGKP